MINLSTTEEQLRQSQKMEAIGTLAGGVAHDFNNILMGIQGHVSLMLLQISSTHPFYERLKNMERLVESGSKLTSQLIGYARKGRYEVKLYDFNTLIQQAAQGFKQARSNIHFVFDFAADLLAAEADKNQIEQVFRILFDNAADAMPEGGEIAISTGNREIQPTLNHDLELKPGHYIHVTVRDTGIGMNDSTRERIFEPFFTTKEMGRGTGLGLASVYGIIKGHDGYIDVKSQPACGTTFDIYFPVTQQSSVLEERLPYDHIIRGSETILFVDDDLEIIKVGKSLLEVMGYRVFTAENGTEALQIYERWKNQIDIVLLDMIMPGMDGGIVHERLKAINPNVRILLLSGYSRDREATAILANRCNGFIQKPFKIQDLSRSIRQVIGSQAHHTR